jgi:4-hydroxybenzoate polyprenyltransferase
VQSTCIQLGMNNHFIAYSILTFFATLFIYNLQRIFYTVQEDKSLLSPRRRWVFKNQPIIKILSCIGFIGVVILFFYNDWHIVLYLSPLLLLSIAYFIPAIQLRKNAWFKLLTLVTVWTMVTAVVPILLNHSSLMSFKNSVHIAARFSFMMAICIPFDIRDYEIDKADNISTLPHILGEKKTKWLAILFMAIHVAFVFMAFGGMIFYTKEGIALLLSSCFTFALVGMSNSKRSEYFYVAGIDGTMLLQGIALLLASLSA